jgi:hypothetical protein
LTKGDEGTLWFQEHLVDPKNHELWKKIFDEAHTSKYSIHPGVDVSYAAPQAHKIINVALHREYPPGIIFIFSHGRKYLYHV